MRIILRGLSSKCKKGDSKFDEWMNAATVAVKVAYSGGKHTKVKCSLNGYIQTLNSKTDLSFM